MWVVLQECYSAEHNEVGSRNQADVCMDMEGERFAFLAEAKARVTRRIIACVCEI